MSKRPRQRSALVLGVRMDDNVVVQDLDKSVSVDVDSANSPKKIKADGEENSNGAQPQRVSRALSSKSTTKLSTKPTPITRTRSSASSSALRVKEVEREADNEVDKENKVSITLSENNISEDHTSTPTDNGSSGASDTLPSAPSTIPATTTPSTTPSTTPIPSTTPMPSTTSQRPSGTWRVPTGTKGNSKYNTLPLPPKSKYPNPTNSSAPGQTTTNSPTLAQTTTNSSTPGQTTTSSSTPGQTTTNSPTLGQTTPANKPTAPSNKPASTLGKTSAPSLTSRTPSGKPPAKLATKPPASRPLSTLQLQEQTRKLLQQIHQQQQQLEQQQQQLEHSHLTQQQLQQKLQLQELEQQLIQAEQNEKEKQVEKHQQPWQHFQNGQPQLSPAAKTFISQNAFQSHHSEKRPSPSSSDFLHIGTYIAEFIHTPSQAIAAYNDWKESQWLIPHSFSSQLDPLMLTPMHLPFYSFSLITHSVHSGKVGYFKKPVGPEVSSIEFSAIQYEFAKDRAETFALTQLHPDVLVYAPSFELVTTPDYDLMQEIWYWKLGDLSPHNAPASSKRLNIPILTRSNGATSLDVKMPHPTTAQDAWAYAHKKLIENERYCADQTIKRQHLCDAVEEIHTKTTFSHIAVKLIYLPVYVWTHNYQGATYQTVMNAQNGIIYGQRPYSLSSSLDSCFQLLAGGEQLLSKNDVIHGVISGSTLAQRDNFPTHASPYRVDLPYIVFPPSDQFLVMVATGWLRVQNTSESEAVELVAQKRTSSHIGRSLILLPGAEKVIAYRGAWCFCVTIGDPQSVLIAYVCTHSGADKEDLMGMV